MKSSALSCCPASCSRAPEFTCEASRQALPTVPLPGLCSVVGLAVQREQAGVSGPVDLLRQV